MESCKWPGAYSALGLIILKRREFFFWADGHNINRAMNMKMLKMFE